MKYIGCMDRNEAPKINRSNKKGNTMFTIYSKFTVHKHTSYENDVERLATCAVRGPGAVKDMHELRVRLAEQTWLGADAVLYWTSNDAPVPAHVFCEAALRCPQHQVDEDRRYQDNVIARYKAAQSDEPSEEELFEARAAHGPGVEIVNVFTGRRFTT